MTHRTMSTDVVIIGAGPTGLYGAYYAGFRGLRCVVVDALPQVGGQISTLYPEKSIGDVAGLPGIRGRDFVAALARQASEFDPRYELGQRALELQFVGGEPRITLDSGLVIEAQAVVLAAGIGMARPRSLGCGDEWMDIALSHFVLDPAEHVGQDVVVVGGGDSALDWADALADRARSVRIVHRRPSFRGHAATLDRIRAKGAVLCTDAEVVGLVGDLAAGKLNAVTVRHRSGETETHRADHVVAALGFISNLGPLATWDLELTDRSVAVDRTMRTNLPRVFAAGDIATYPGKVKLMSVGFGEIATAMNHVAVELDPTLGLFPGHSTDQDSRTALEEEIRQ